MMSKAAFSAEDWVLVTEAPLVAGAHVVAADGGGTVREGLVVRRVYAAARELRGESALLDDLVSESPLLDLHRVWGSDDSAAVSQARLRAAVDVVKAKTPADVDAYKGFVLAVAHAVAEANREGGFAGIGGEEVSAREQAALDEIAAL